MSPARTPRPPGADMSQCGAGADAGPGSAVPASGTARAHLPLGRRDGAAEVSQTDGLAQVRGERHRGGVRRGRSCRRLAWPGGGLRAGRAGWLVTPVGQRAIQSRAGEGSGQPGIPCPSPTPTLGPRWGGGAPRGSGHSSWTSFCKAGAHQPESRAGSIWASGLGHRRPAGVCGRVQACAGGRRAWGTSRAAPLHSPHLSIQG